MEKERRTKALLLSTLVVVVATLSIAFASLSRTLSINGIGKMDTASWSVYFDNLGDAKITRGAQEVKKPNISTIDNGILENINVKLSNPKDEISYTVDIVNDGTIDAEITMIKDIELTDVQKKVFEFKVTYTDTGEILKDGDLLPKKTTKNITINIKFKDDITEFDLPTESQTINLSYQITYTQYDGNVPVGPNGSTESTEKAILAHDIDTLMSSNDPSLAPFFNGTLPRIKVESIDFLSSNIVPTEYEDYSWDASLKKDGSVMAWHTGLNENNLYNVYIGGNGGVYAPSDSSGMFFYFESLSTINFNNNFYTINVTNMRYMFAMTICETIDLSSFDTRNVTNFKSLFLEFETSSFLNLSNWNTSSVTDMSEMFGCYTSGIDVSGWDTSNVTNMSGMFAGWQFETLDLSHFDTKNVVDFSNMFAGSNLVNLNVSTWDTSSAENFSKMFSDCEKLKKLSLTSWDTSSVTNMSEMFRSCDSMNEIDLSTWNTSKVTDMSSMFEYTENLTAIKLNSADFSNVTSSGEMIYCINQWDGCTIYVKDQAAYDFIFEKAYGPNAQVIIEPLSA